MKALRFSIEMAEKIADILEENKICEVDEPLLEALEACIEEATPLLRPDLDALDRLAANAVTCQAYGETVRVVNSADLNAVERMLDKARNEDLVCTLCGTSAKLAEDGYYRHSSDNPWEDGSGFCDKYGYSIQVRKKSNNSIYVSPEVVHRCTEWLRNHSVEQPNGDLLVPATEACGKALADSLKDLLSGV